MKQFKLRFNDPVLSLFLSSILESHDAGAMCLICDNREIVFKQEYKFSIPGIEVGVEYRQNDFADNIINSGQVQKFFVSREVYNIPLTVLGGPLWSDDYSNIEGIWMLITPREHPLIASFDSFAPKTLEALSEGGSMYITDKNSVIKKQGSTKFDVPLKVGDPTTKLPVAMEVMQTGKQDVREVPVDLWGIALNSIVDPIFDQETGEVVGAFGMGLPRQIPYQLNTMAKQLGQNLNEVSATMQEIASTSAEVMDNQSSLHQSIAMVDKLTNEIDEIAGLIKGIADETKMLGLNAAIEAARAGDAGLGFGVVANEIRKLSDDSRQTVEQIKDLTSRIRGMVNNTTAASSATLSSTENQAAAVEEITASISDINSMAQNLESIAKQL